MIPAIWTSKVEKVEVTTRAMKRGMWSDSPVELFRGEDVTMENGEVWFHPYDGGKPVKIRDRYEAVF